MNEVPPPSRFPILNILPDEPSVGLEIDPICGMSVDPRTAILCDKDGKTWYFCSEYCRTKFVSPAQVSTSPPPAGTRYFCPMCPDVFSDHPANCPTCGMALEPELTSTTATDQYDGQLDLWRRFRLAVTLTVPLVVLAMGPMVGLPLDHLISHSASAIAQLFLAVPVVGWCGWPFWVAGARSFANRQWNMFTLIMLGVGAAFGFSLWLVLMGTHHGHDLYFESASVITTLVLLGQILEGNARRRTGEAIRELLELAPQTAHILEDGVEKDIPLSAVIQGAILRVRPGERVPVDGVILGEIPSLQSPSAEIGRVDAASEAAMSSQHAEREFSDPPLTTIDEAMLTGEPMPVAKRARDNVVGGTMNQSGSFLMRADRVGRSTMLSQIVDMVAKAQRSRAPVQQLADQVSRWFTPAVVFIAGMTFVAWMWLGPSPRLSHAVTNAVAVLIIACPCALGLATPIAITVGMGRGARDGILFRDAESLETLGHVDVLFVDKTGTLTEGHPTVASVVTRAEHSPSDVLQWAGSVEQLSEHPLARAVVRAVSEANQSLKAVTDFQSTPGSGVSGQVEGHHVTVGFNSDATSLSPTDPSRNHRMTSASVVLDGIAIGEIAFTDVVRESAKQGVMSLRTLGIKVCIVTGDHLDAARQVARGIGIAESDVFASLKPSDKLSIINKSRREGRCIAMAGDGINDAPALAAADVGISLGTGTDIAKQSAGIILVRPDIRSIADAIRLSRKVSANVRQNLGFAFAYNGIGIAIAAGALYPFWGITLSPMLAALAMSLSSVSVITNALRLRMRGGH